MSSGVWWGSCPWDAAFQMWISGCCVHSYRCDPPQRDQMRGSGAKWMEEPHLQSFKTAEQTFILKSQASHYRDKTLVHSLFSSAAGSTRVRMCLYGLTSLSGTLYPLCRPSPPPLLHPAGPLWLCCLTVGGCTLQLLPAPRPNPAALLSFLLLW